MSSWEPCLLRTLWAVFWMPSLVLVVLCLPQHSIPGLVFVRVTVLSSFVGMWSCCDLIWHVRRKTQRSVFTWLTGMTNKDSLQALLERHRHGVVVHHHARRVFLIVVLLERHVDDNLSVHLRLLAKCLRCCLKRTRFWRRGTVVLLACRGSRLCTLCWNCWLCFLFCTFVV